jgi:Undecaprenyl-phosphate galactose phosphotransferase WbaP
MSTDSYTVNDSSQNSLIFNKSIVNAYARWWMSGVLVITDMASLLFTLGLTWMLLGFENNFNLPYYQELLGVLVVILLVSFARNGLYPAVGINYVDELRGAAVSISFVFLFLVAYIFMINSAQTYSPARLLLAWGLGMVFIPMARFLVRSLFIRLKLWGVPVIVIGDMDKALPLADYFKRKLNLGLRPEALLCPENCEPFFAGVYPPRTPEEIKAYAASLHIDTALIVINDLNCMDYEVEKYRYIFENIILIKHHLGSYGLNSLRSLDFADVLGLQVRNNLLNPTAQITKRFIDLTASFLGLFFLAPFLLFLIVLIKLDSPGPVFYQQARVGKGNKSFNLLKFRTMFVNGDSILRQKMAESPALKEEWDQYQKIKDDPRITKIGRFLRKFSLDELPQLWNVLIGEMSLVGPRPMMFGQEHLYGETIKDYIRVSPGITGFWQISGRNQTTFIRRAQLDGEYIQKWSVWMDIYILFVTIKVVLMREGAF